MFLVPPEPSEVSNSTATVQSPTTAKFTLKKNLFSNVNGEILYYALIVSTSALTETSGIWDSQDDSTWPPAAPPSKATNQIYQASPLKWQPFKDPNIQEVSFVIGTEKSCTSKFCNKPLEPNTPYYVSVRGLTNNAFIDSKAVQFKTCKSIYYLYTLLFYCYTLLGGLLP